MKTPAVLLAAIFIGGVYCVAGLIAETDDEPDFKPLFDGESLTGWKSARKEGPDGYGPFSVDPDEKAIHVYADAVAGSEQKSDVLYTEKSYSTYILKLEYKWLDQKFAPRHERDRDSGILFHMTNDLNKVWPDCVEMQLGDTPPRQAFKPRYTTGDIFIVGLGVRAEVRKKDEFYDPATPAAFLGEGKANERCWTSLGTEKPFGEWNEVELHVTSSEAAVYYLNGEKVNVVGKMEQEVDGEFQPLASGPIGFQAEWAEVMFRNIQIKELP